MFKCGFHKRICSEHGFIFHDQFLFCCDILQIEQIVDDYRLKRKGKDPVAKYVTGGSEENCGIGEVKEETGDL